MINKSLREQRKIIQFVLSCMKKGQSQNNFLLESLIMTSFEALDDQEKEIFANTYFNRSHMEWWEMYYSRSSYYRLLKSASSKFLDCLWGT